MFKALFITVASNSSYKTHTLPHHLQLVALLVYTDAPLLLSVAMSCPLANANKLSVVLQHVLKQIRALKTTGMLLFSILHHVFINLHLDLMSMAIK